MKNDHKLIMENWRKFTSEEEQEQLDEGIKEFLLGAAMMLAPGLANALTVDGHSLKDVSTQLQQAHEDGNPHAEELARTLADALKNKDKDGKPKIDLDGDGDIGDELKQKVGYDAGEAFDDIMNKSSADKPSPKKGFDVEGAVKKANQKASDAASDKLGIPRDFTGTGS